MSSTLTKSDLIDLIAEKVDCSKSIANEVLTAAFSLIIDSVSEGQKVSIAKFGIFEGKVRSERKGRNPRTGEEITIKASVAPTFKASKSFKDQTSPNEVEVD